MLCAVLPLLFCVSLVCPRLSTRFFMAPKTCYQFFCLQLIQNVTMAVGPIVQYHQNSKFYSARPPRPNKQVDSNLPHITIQMPVYKEGLEAVLCARLLSNRTLPHLKLFHLFVFSAPSIAFLKKAMQTYARQGGTSNIFINDDGLRVILPTPWSSGIPLNFTLYRHSQIVNAMHASHSTMLMVSDGSLGLLMANQARMVMAQPSYVPVASRKPRI